MDARSCLLIFLSILIVLHSHSGHLIDATGAVPGPSNADTYDPSFDFSYKFEVVSRRLKSGRLRPPPPTANPYFHTQRPPMHPYKYKSPPPRPASPPPPPPMST
ncbi:hypothetical protein DITRI_Ditri06bG0144400 [Diplodiscus trichospermus]